MTLYEIYLILMIILTCALETLSGQAFLPLLINLPPILLPRAEGIPYPVHLQLATGVSSVPDFALQLPPLAHLGLVIPLPFHRFLQPAPDPLILNNYCN